MAEISWNFLGCLFKIEIIHEYPDVGINLPLHGAIPSLCLSADEIYHNLKYINPLKACGCDKISGVVLKECADELNFPEPLFLTFLLDL